ncbi:MAG: hypothetical protein Q8S21_04970 [Candidatus Paracaedibacteraceae bacterium]|nr:hypothetical protein [Candidatus Paracaedibacteraceae bacterium]
MKKILNMLLLTLTVQCSAYAANKAEILKIIDARFQIAAENFNGNETGEIKAANGSSNRDTKDTPMLDETSGYMKPINGTSEMICYKSDTGKIVTADSPNKIGTDFDKGLASKIAEELQKNDDGKVEINYTISIKDPNEATKNISESMLAIAWAKKALTGKLASTLVCVVTAPAPAGQ